MNAPTSITASDLDLIRAALLKIAGTQQTGTQIRALIDLTCPQFDLRAAVGVPVGSSGALTKLLMTYFADLAHPVGKNGGDTVFWIGGPRPDLVEGNVQPSETNLWATFANPRFDGELVFDREDQTFSIGPRGGMLSADQVRITPISEEDFRNIAEQFVENSPPGEQDELRRVLDSNDFSYRGWYSVIQKSPEMNHRWGLFRVQAIAALFRDRLSSAEVPQEKADRAVRLMIKDQEAAYKERTRASRSTSLLWKPPITQRTPPVQISEINDVSDARTMAISAIQNMSISEIRQIKVPLGAILDAASRK